MRPVRAAPGTSSSTRHRQNSIENSKITRYGRDSPIGDGAGRTSKLNKKIRPTLCAFHGRTRRVAGTGVLDLTLVLRTESALSKSKGQRRMHVGGGAGRRVCGRLRTGARTRARGEGDEAAPPTQADRGGRPAAPPCPAAPGGWQARRPSAASRRLVMYLTSVRHASQRRTWIATRHGRAGTCASRRRWHLASS